MTRTSLTEEHKLNIGKALKNRIFSSEWKNKLRLNHASKKEGFVHPMKKEGYQSPLLGRKYSTTHKQHMSEHAGKHRKGLKLSPNPVSNEKRNPYRYNIIVMRLLSPESKCMNCNVVFDFNKLHVHHEDIFNRQPETVDINKLKVLCERCHKQADMKIWKDYKDKEEVAG